MKGSCLLPECGLKDGLACELGHIEFIQCPHFKPGTPDLAQDVGALVEDASGQRLPWTGRGLGLNDVILVSGRSAANLIGLVGPFSAGKTSFLTALFAHFAKSGN